jgi:hypothetical protein
MQKSEVGCRGRYYGDGNVKHLALVLAAEFSQTEISRGNGCEKGWDEF